MAVEIERKFLIDVAKISELTNGTSIKQGYIRTQDHTAVRARVQGDRAFLTIKGENNGATRSEFEYPIPRADAEQIIAELCAGVTVDKMRYLINHSGHTWEIDIFSGDNQGLIVAEVELGSADETLAIPNWVIKEVTGDHKYYNSNLLTNPFKHWPQK